jgi:anaerobic selenocysteine-containing dehydrogenase
MGQKDRDTGKGALSRRDFLKASAAGAAAVGIAEFAQVGPAAAAITGAAATFHTTCPYCSASCGQLVAVDSTDPAVAKVIDLYGDWRAPWNTGGLCAKGAGGFQLVNNPRRVGAWTGPELLAMTGSSNHPVDNAFRADGTTNGVAYKRVANGPWSAMPLDTALGEIVNGDGTQTGLKAIRGTVDNANKYHSKNVAFFGCSHINNEQNYLLKKLTANFGTNNCEHQARI